MSNNLYDHRFSIFRALNQLKQKKNLSGLSLAERLEPGNLLFGYAVHASLLSSAISDNDSCYVYLFSETLIDKDFSSQRVYMQKLVAYRHSKESGSIFSH